MASGNAVWGIEIGQCALKAMKLRHSGEGQVELLAFDIIEHPKILSQSDAEPDELIKAAIEKFVSRNDWQGDRFVLGVPGQQTFSRFCKLPPVEEKKIPEIVRFEASQQIPFEISDVVWDYEVFRTEGSPDVEVGIFAMRKDLVRKHIEYFSAVGISPSTIQTLPSALYNFCRFDDPGEIKQNVATVIVDVGAQKTDLIVVEPNSAWSRNIPLGGNNFTEALVRAFKLSFGKAESLKKTAAESKHARQVFQAMRPVFADLVAEIQRSIGFYSSTHREVQLQRVLACGNAFRLTGLQKYLETNLSIPGGVAVLEKFNKLVTTQTSNAPQFMENLLSFAPAYGLAIQGLGLAKINANLLPPDLARVALWKKKTPYFIATAAALALAAALPYTRTVIDNAALASTADAGNQASAIIRTATDFQKQFAQAQTDTSGKKNSITQLFELQKEKVLVPTLFQTVLAAVPRQPELEKVQSPAELKKLLEANKGRLDRTARRQVMIDSVRLKFSKSIDNEERVAPAGGTSTFAPSGDPGGAAMGARGPGGRSGGMMGDGDMGMPAAPAADAGAGGAAEAPGFYVHIRGRTTFGKTEADVQRFITSEFYENLRKLGRRAGLGFYIPEEDPKNLNTEPPKRNLGSPVISQFVPTAPGGGGPAPGGARGGSRSGGGDDMMFSAAGPEGEQDKHKDPVTGEDMSTDWVFDFGFKIKLGEMPPDPNAPPAGQPGAPAAPGAAQAKPPGGGR